MESERRQVPRGAATRVKVSSAGSKSLLNLENAASPKGRRGKSSLRKGDRGKRESSPGKERDATGDLGSSHRLDLPTEHTETRAPRSGALSGETARGDLKSRGPLRPDGSGGGQLLTHLPFRSTPASHGLGPPQ